MSDTNKPGDAVMAVIITFNPELTLFRECLKSVTDQVSAVIVIDNASKNVCEIEIACSKFPTATLTKNSVNLGLPINYNLAARKAEELGYKWLLIMDQDSILPQKYIETAEILFTENDVALIGPQFWDINLETYEEFLERLPEEKISTVDACISSGSLCRVSVIQQLGGFDEKMFIDYVDYDYCRNCTDAGYKVMQLNECIMEHQIGISKKIRFLGVEQIIESHSPIRKYYFFRNKAYYARKHKITVYNDPRFYTGFAKNLILLLYEEEPRKKLIAAFKGVWDAFKM